MTKAALLFVLQAGAILGWAGYEERVRSTSPTFRIPLRPTDPYDLVRGRYFVLHPVDSTIDLEGASSPFSPAQREALMREARGWKTSALVGFCPQGAVLRVCAVRPGGGEVIGAPATVWVEGHVSALDIQGYGSAPRRWELDVDLGLERFFIPNRAVLPASENEPGWELEVSHRPGRTLLPRRLWFKGKPVVF